MARGSSPADPGRVDCGCSPATVAIDTVERHAQSVNNPASDLPTAQDWRVLPHGPIQSLAENLWRIEGELPHFSLRRVMTVVRLGDGRLVIHSAIALEEPAMQRLEAWGTPAFLLFPHARHRL